MFLYNLYKIRIRFLPDILRLGSAGVGTGPGVSSGLSFRKPATTRGAGDCSPTSIASQQHFQ